VVFYVQQHNEVMPNAALGGRTPDEVFWGEAADLVERLREKHQVAIAERMAANRRLECGECTVLRESQATSEPTGAVTAKTGTIPEMSQLRTRSEGRS
jgi:hypothetical protein